MSIDLFDLARENKTSPLADRMRPGTLDEFIGQEHLVGEGKLLRRAIMSDKLGSCIFYGAPGVGKTTLAGIIAKHTRSEFVVLNAVSSGVADAKKVIEQAVTTKKLYGKSTYLLLDECHRWNKAQSDCVLQAIEEGTIVFIGSTTENPFVSMTRAIVSRCRLFEFKQLTAEDVAKGLERAVTDERGYKNYLLNVSREAYSHIARLSHGDMRAALNALELAVATTDPSSDGVIYIDVKVAEECIQKKSFSLDESLYYDMLSAFCKSIRGSDTEAALFWAFRLINAGIDPMIILRRLIAHSCEDVGMADPNALVVAAAALQAYERIGMPEAKLCIANAVIYVTEAPKSNSVYTALHRAEELAGDSDDSVPMHLRDTSYKAQKIDGYLYPHNYAGWVEQQYLPDGIKDEIFYIPGKNGYESKFKRAKIIKKERK